MFEFLSNPPPSLTASYSMNYIQIKQMVLEYVFYLSPEKLIFTAWGLLHCHPHIFIT